MCLVHRILLQAVCSLTCSMSQMPSISPGARPTPTPMARTQTPPLLSLGAPSSLTQPLPCWCKSLSCSSSPKELARGTSLAQPTVCSQGRCNCSLPDLSTQTLQLLCAVSFCLNNSVMLPYCLQASASFCNLVRSHDSVSVLPAGQGFGINPAIYDNRDGFFNALGGLQTLVANRPVKAATIITPHVYGAQITGLLSHLLSTFNLHSDNLHWHVVCTKEAL